MEKLRLVYAVVYLLTDGWNILKISTEALAL